jgi:mannose-6-phosphate isomerase-like protein (cupin superfamily)
VNDTASSSPYTHRNLGDVPDSASRFGLEEFQETRFANDDLETRQVGFTHHRIKANSRPPFAHRHQDAEEVYVVLSGSGRVKLGDEVLEIGALDAIRVEPSVTRGFEAGPDGLELLAFGQHHAGDGEIVENWWT